MRLSAFKIQIPIGYGSFFFTSCLQAGLGRTAEPWGRQQRGGGWWLLGGSSCHNITQVAPGWLCGMQRILVNSWHHWIFYNKIPNCLRKVCEIESGSWESWQGWRGWRGEWGWRDDRVTGANFSLFRTIVKEIFWVNVWSPQGGHGAKKCFDQFSRYFRPCLGDFFE